MIHIQLCYIFGYPCSMPRYAKKRTYRRKRSYSTKKRSYFKRTRYAKYRKTYRKKAVLSRNPFKATSSVMRRQYAHYIAQSNAGPLKVPQGVTLTLGNEVQSIQFRSFRLDTFELLDNVLNKFNSLYQYYRMKHVWVELTPKWNIVPDITGNQCGEIAIIPLHKPEEIYRSGQANVGFGGTFPILFEFDIERWMTVPGARRFKVVKGQPARMKIPLTSFDYVIDSPSIGSSTGFSSESRSVKARWLPVMDIGGVATPTVSSVRHYGFAIMFYGWDTSAANVEFDFVLRQWLEVEYKSLNVWPVLAGIGTERKDEELGHVEEPWEEEDSKSQSSHAEPALKRAFTNMNLTPTTVSTMPSPQATAGARPNPRVTRA